MLEELILHIVSANSTLVELFYANIIESDLDKMFLELSINRKVIRVTPATTAHELGMSLGS